MLIAEDDYAPVETTRLLFIPEDHTTIMCIPVDLVDDDLVEEEEAFLLRIDSVSASLPGAVVGPQAETRIIITDNDGLFCSCFVMQFHCIYS